MSSSVIPSNITCFSASGVLPSQKALLHYLQILVFSTSILHVGTICFIDEFCIFSTSKCMLEFPNKNCWDRDYKLDLLLFSMPCILLKNKCMLGCCFTTVLKKLVQY